MLPCGLQTQDLVLYGEGSGEKDLDRSPRDWSSSSQHGVSHKSHESVVRFPLALAGAAPYTTP
jgi:hypothetical protein